MSRARLLPILPWMLAPLVVACLYVLLPFPTDLRSQYQGSAVALVSAPLLAWLLARDSPLAHHTGAALVASVLPGLTLISLHGTDWFFSGPFGDQSFRLEYAARFADDLGSLSDYTYRDVPAFYSPGWFWVVGLVSAITDVPPWHAYKWVSIASLYLAAVVAFALWRRTASSRLSAALLAASVIGLPFAGSGWLGGETLLFAGAYEPYAWLVALPLPALLAWFVAAQGPFSWRRGLGLGALLAAAAYLYLLYALVAVVAVLVVAAGRWRDHRRLLEVAAAGVASIVLVSPWLGRFLVVWLAGGAPATAATTWVQGGDSYVHLVVPAPSPWVVVALMGAIGIIAVTRRGDPRLRGCQAVGAAIVLLGFFQLLAGQAASGVLFHRLLIVLGVALLAAGVLLAVAMQARAKVVLEQFSPAPVLRRAGGAALVILLFMGLSGHAREWMTMGADLRKLAHDVPYPDGALPLLASSETRTAVAGQPSVDQLAEAAAQVARAAGQSETGVVLTDDIALLATTPLHGYLQWWELYSNPLGRYPERRAFLESLSARPPGQIVSTLRARDEAPTVFVLELDGDEVTFGSASWDTGTAKSSPWTVRLPRALFQSQEFVTARVGDRLVAALRPG